MESKFLKRPALFPELEVAELSETTEHDLARHTGPDLREAYITPFYLETIADRVPDWSTEHLRKQMQLFRRTIPDYPEVIELFEGELHRRNLNELNRAARRASPEKLRQLIEKYGTEPDYREILETELELRRGVSHLYDASGET